jgi:hypothetical protein
MTMTTLPAVEPAVNAEFYGTSPLKRSRRTSDEMKAMLVAIQTILDAEDDQITIRHLFYRLVGQHVIAKTETAYKSLCSHLSKWRRSGEIEWGAFSDSTCWHIQDKVFDDMQAALADAASTYRRNLWRTQPCYVEVWVEKDAMAGIVAPVANAFGVPVFVARGFASLSSLYEAANTFKDVVEGGKRPIIYHLGDYDPSGVAAGESIQAAFREDFEVDVQFIRAAVTPEQIQRLKLPTRPVKTTDGRAKKWTGGDCVELDTMPPNETRRLVEECITKHIDQRQWEITKIAEASERTLLKQICRRKAA